ncbi:ABC transporter ATP-binding protein [Spongiactinospora sp. TRM90649]|uniref:ABC transporter ATP-binding protein n=1 Tax=Spongiactinospora sp. TRM90649 TaxID=3031114 RepID=UPI0023F6C7D1|nr:ABC transporter ATP-binding protein [Spongiactinospora sp. TRM90649]MDF5752287.1 ABC transporter ATP-binding protein [Spongiactinospora sp. TRM90649]
MTPRQVLWGVLRARPRTLARLAAWSVVESAPAFLIGFVVARAIDDGFAAGLPGTGLAWLGVLAVAWGAAAFGARQVVLAVAGIAEPLRDELLGHVVEGALRRASDAFQAPAPGGSAAVARANLQVELARDAFAAVVTVVRGFAFILISVTLGMLTLLPQVALLVLPPFAAGLALFLLSLPALARRQRAYLLADERTAEELTGLAGGLRDIAACGAEDRVAATVERQVDAQATAARSLARVTAARTAALAVGGWLPVVLVLAGTPWLLDNGAAAGTIVGALAYVTQSLSPALNGLVEGVGVSGVRLMASLDRILRSSPPAVAPDTTAPPPGDGFAVELRGVTFAYGPHAEPVVDALDLVVPEGDHLAVVGPSGAGKSTLTALITGMLRPGDGEVLVGGIPADRVPPDRRVLIPQEAYVFRGTLEENLTYLSGAARADVEAAVAALGAGPVVDRCGGYGAEVDPGALSAGQRQLVALVRAYLSDARLVILDEATGGLDPAAEELVERAFAARGGTLIVVAHRLTSALRARRVLLMDGGRVRLGTHDELVRSAPPYADLVGHWEPEYA